MAVTEKQLIADLKKGNYHCVYLLTGEENYAVDVLSDYFECHVIPEDFRDFDQTVLYGRDVTMADVVSAAKRFPMMSPYQLILVKEAQEIRNWEPLTGYLSNPQKQTILVFCYRHKKLDKRTQVYKAIHSKGIVFEKSKLYDSQLPDWILGYVREKGYDISQKGAMLIAESLGNDLSKIANELSKIFISAPKGSTITEEVIEDNVGISKDYNIFELQNAIGKKDVLKCNKIIKHFASNPKEYPIQATLPVLYNFFIKVMMYHQVEDKKTAASAMGVSPFFLKDYQQAASHYSLGKLASIITYLSEADLKSKGIGNSGTVTDGELLKELLFKILH